MIKLNKKEQLIMAMLFSPLPNNIEEYGVSLVNKSQGRLKKGTIYVYLQSLEEKGLIESRKEERNPGTRGLARRLYRITDEGLSLITNISG